jgi:hypothetical protein
VHRPATCRKPVKFSLSINRWRHGSHVGQPSHLCRRVPIYLCGATGLVLVMTSYEQTGGVDSVIGWRAIGSAWLLVLFVVGVLVGFSTLAARHPAWYSPVPAREQVVVPRHDPACDPAAPASVAACPATSPFGFEGVEGTAPM